MGFWGKIFGKGGSYFLDDETAKGMGDTEYMKEAKAVRRTFPGAAGEEEFEVTRTVSSMDKTVNDSREGGVAPAPKSASSNSSYGSSFGSASSFGSSSFGGGSSFGSASSAETPAPTPAPEPEKPAAAKEPSFQPSRSGNVDTGMDMFRDMAKKVGR
jgi:hypothetical protein